ncbi:hypothetical protein AVEN_12149-1 [Araneus ventricosus]|uniref:Uncharacterized protein n=1 Tax=Araneus ventricosus TaxID=182803 RepID=A0A4Y2LPS4_ARAVE|nr:hypothetical protein AVEN_12149-1 [Araneus ventricosus]
MEGGVGQATLDDISRRHKLSYEIKMIEIGLLVGAGGFLQGFSPLRMYNGEVFFPFRSKMQGGVGQATLDDISKRHKLSYEIKMIEIGLVVGAVGFVQGFPH